MTDELMALLAKATAGEFEKARGAPAPDSIWLIYGGGGEDTKIALNTKEILRHRH